MQHWDAADKSNHYDAIKFVATFLVVLAHASRMYTGTGVVIPYNASDGLNHLTNIIYSFHMPLYMSVSGMVYALCIHDYQKYQDTARFAYRRKDFAASDCVRPHHCAAACRFP